MKPTDGTWTFTQHPSGDCGIAVSGVTGVFIECYADIRHPYEFAREEARANAKLVCAAKRLLDAAKLAIATAAADEQDEWFAELKRIVAEIEGSTNA